MIFFSSIFFFFFFNDTATTEIYTLSLHDALPIGHDRIPAAGFRGHSRRYVGQLRVGRVLVLGSQGDVVADRVAGLRRLPPCSHAPRLGRPSPRRPPSLRLRHGYRLLSGRPLPT